VVEVGPLSGVEADLLQSAFEALSPGTMLEGADFIIERPPLSGQCRTCGKEFDFRNLELQCPHCGSSDVQITGGEELLLKSLEVETEE